MPPTEESASSERKEPAAERRKAKGANAAPEQQAGPDLLSVTIDAANGRIVSLERVDESGARRALSDEEKASVTNGRAGATIERLVEEAFEAGIECVLGGNEEPQETSTDDELSHILLQSLLERSKARRLIQAEVLNKAIVGTLVEEAATPEAATAH